MSVDISLNSSLIIQIVNFIILIIALNAVLYKPIRGILAKRKNVVDKLGEDADAAVNQARASEIKFREDIKAARMKGAQKKNEIVEAAAKEESHLLMGIHEESKEKLEEVKAKISKETEAARASLEKDIGIFASEIAKKVLGRAV